MEWTFDPLEIKNAHLNILRLGAIVRRYKREFLRSSFAAAGRAAHGPCLCGMVAALASV